MSTRYMNVPSISTPYVSSLYAAQRTIDACASRLGSRELWMIDQETASDGVMAAAFDIDAPVRSHDETCAVRIYANTVQVRTAANTIRELLDMVRADIERVLTSIRSAYEQWRLVLQQQTRRSADARTYAPRAITPSDVPHTHEPRTDAYVISYRATLHPVLNMMRAPVAHAPEAVTASTIRGQGTTNVEPHDTSEVWLRACAIVLSRLTHGGIQADQTIGGDSNSEAAGYPTAADLKLTA